jgi:diacylglycerol kinase (ATP)
MRITLIVNAEPGEVEVLRREVDRLRAEGHQVSPRLTFEGGDARWMAREAAARGAEVVVAAGGDGTLNEVVNGLHDHITEEGARVPPRLAVAPLGTANDFARSVGIPADAAAALDVAVNGDVIETDVGMVNERCFLNVSTGGFGAEATEEAPDEAKRALGPLAYMVTGVRKFATLEISRASFVADEVLYEGPFLIFAVGNSRRTGGGNLLTPRAELCDGKLDLCVVHGLSRVEFVRLLPQLRNGTHLGHPAIVYRQVDAVTVRSDEELSVNADGEPLHARVFRYRVSEHRLKLAVPRGYTGLL